jgi:hypothetical protein
MIIRKYFERKVSDTELCVVVAGPFKENRETRPLRLSGPPGNLLSRQKK